MPESKNTFIQSKMNKDMDGRMLPNGQYRDGQNIQISRSEGDDVGALENVLGNEFLTNFGLDTIPNLEIIGDYTDDTTNTIFLFLTNYSDSSNTQLDNPAGGKAGNCYIVSYNVKTQTSNILVEGNFLNFSKLSPITGINLLEDLLFWTDNRNQPRKININLAVPGYYTTEDQISVAKYYPYDPILLLDDIPLSEGASIGYNSTMKDKVSEYLPIHAAAAVKEDFTVANTIIVHGIYTNVKPTTPGAYLNGDFVSGINISGEIIVNTVTLDYANNQTTIVVGGTGANTFADLIEGDIIYFQRQNPDLDAAWPGDPDYLKSKFVRFSYRLKFDDGEYSLVAPFTQIAFVPEQDGYFIGNGADNQLKNPSGSPTSGTEPTKKLVGQESETYDSTVVKFMENKINDIGLNILAPTVGNENEKINWSQVNSILHVIEVDIIYKESQSNQQLIVDTLTLDDFGSVNSPILSYSYQSRQPWKTLPSNQTTRVNDVVPVRALAQESSGNRIIYGNFVDKHSSPINLNYMVQVNQKPDLPVGPSAVNFKEENYYVKKEYPNHTLKQNRTYQVGVVLSDRYGRQSNVILSKIINPTTLASEDKGSTIYHRYRSVEDSILLDKYSEDNFCLSAVDPYSWPGDQLFATFFSGIPKLKDGQGYPGVYSVADGSVGSLNALNPITYTPNAPAWDPSSGNCEVEATFISVSNPSNTGSCRVTFNSSGEVSSIVPINSSGVFDNNEIVVLTFVGPYNFGCDVTQSPVSTAQRAIVQTPIDNPLGWYSYKIVIKQSEQEYYNVYLPTTLAGYPCQVINVDDPPTVPTLLYPQLQEDNSAHIVLFGDNINKVPRDLQEVGPVQEKFRSSVRMFGRVTNIIDTATPLLTDSFSNKQYDPGDKWDIAVEIGNMEELGLGNLTFDPAAPIIPPMFYKGETNPLIARVETRKQFGWDNISCNNSSGNTDTLRYGPTLSVYETAPVESLLDIFWETTTSGLISDLNFSIENDDNTIPEGITNTEINWSEDSWYGDYISNTFEAAGLGNIGLGPSCQITLDSVIRVFDNANVTGQFELEEQGLPGSGEYRIKLPDFTGSNYKPLFVCWQSPSKNEYIFYFTITRLATATDPQVIVNTQATGVVTNIEPEPRGFPTRAQIKEDTNPGILIGDANKATYEARPTINYRSYQGEPAINNSDGSFCSGCGIEGDVNWGIVNNQRITKYLPQQTGGVSSAGPCYITTPPQNALIDLTGISPWFGLANYNINILTSDSTCNGLFETFPYPDFDSRFFQAFNGAYSSPNFPPSTFRAEELVYSIPRMYQVSTYVPRTMVNNSILDPSQCAINRTGPVELIFGYNNNILINNLGDNLPKNPIYWANDASQLDILVGEEFVGQRYNNYFHYWGDLQQALIEITGGNFDPGNIAGMPDFMKLTNGANSFYEFYQGGPVNAQESINNWTILNSCSAQNDPAIIAGLNANNTIHTAQKNAVGCNYYLGGIDQDGLGPINSGQKFYARTYPVTQGGSGYQDPRKGAIWAGNFNSVSSTWGFNQAGNGLPGGRYVVTLRVTDRGGSGLFYEWDVPIWLPNFRAGTSSGEMGQTCVRCS